jgi:L-lactate dehydrogenase complex protein LldE
MSERPRVALFVTCLVDLFRPSVGFAAVELIEGAGCAVEVPLAQTCCGQPAYNSGDEASARNIAARVIDTFKGYDQVVVPSGSCAAMIKLHYPRLFANDPARRANAEDLAARTHELLSFLTDVRGIDLDVTFDGKAAYHDSCSGLRELGIKGQPRALLAQVAGLELAEHGERETCCGFGGTFCVKFPEISTKMADKVVDAVAGTGADILLGGDMGCLMNLAGRMRRRHIKIRVRHAAEVLAGRTGTPAIGEGS